MRHIQKRGTSNIVRCVETPFVSSSGINMLFKVVFGVKG
jgi:hypothetical protein